MRLICSNKTEWKPFFANIELDEQTFKDLVHRNRDLIWQVRSSYKLNAAWTTEDAFHEVLCELWRGYRTFDRRSNEST